MKNRSAYLLSLFLSPSAVLLPARLMADASAASENSPAVPPLTGSSSPLIADIHDINGPVTLLDPFPFLTAGGAALLLVTLLWVVLFLVRRHRLRKSRPPDSWADQALASLVQARRLLQEQGPIQYAATVADILRVYIEKRFDLNTLSRTTTEFFCRLEQAGPDQTGIPPEHADHLKSCLILCDLAKYAGYSPAQENIVSLETKAEAFILATSDSDRGEVSDHAISSP